MSDLLPSNASTMERALSSAAGRLGAVPAPIGSLWDPETCPPAYLPWLAWALSVDVWDPAWPDAVKRQVIRDSFAVHRAKGTASAVRRALAATGAPSEIVEWWQSGGAPHTFLVRVDVSALIRRGRAFDTALIHEIARSIDAVKPVRSHYDIAPFYGVSGSFYIGAFASVVTRIDVLPLLPKSISVSVEFQPFAITAVNARVDVLEGPDDPAGN